MVWKHDSGKNHKGDITNQHTNYMVVMCCKVI